MEEWFAPFSLVLYLCHNISSDSNSIGFSIRLRDGIYGPFYHFFHHLVFLFLSHSSVFYYFLRTFITNK